jgi:cyclopropane-fatty-acyl-phospholipid synthase
VEKAVATTRRLLSEILGELPSDMNVRLWDGSFWPHDRPARASLVLRHPGALRAMFLPGDEVSMGEAYLFDDIDVQGDMETVYGVSERILQNPLGWWDKIRLASQLLRLPRPERARATRRGRAALSGQEHSVQRDRQAIAYHYDVSNDFYQLWLDRRMIYSCAYFEAEDEDLDTAQTRKLEYICRKLHLQPGQRLLDIGCGWGGLPIYAAQHYGVDVTGITLSEAQAELANDRIHQSGLSDRCRVRVQDYRDVDESEPYDALVSVGMFEHVGQALLPTYFAKAWRLLRPAGLFMNHGIANRARKRRPRRRTFSEAYVFPDGELVPISTSARVAEETGFEVRDIESLREHYALTLRHWVRRLEAHHDQTLRHIDEPTYRVWRLFMSGSAYGFATGRNNVYQTLLVRPDEQGNSDLPLGRAHWYRQKAPAPPA